MQKVNSTAGCSRRNLVKAFAALTAAVIIFGCGGAGGGTTSPWFWTQNPSPVSLSAGSAAPVVLSPNLATITDVTLVNSTPPTGISLAKTATNTLTVTVASGVAPGTYPIPIELSAVPSTLGLANMNGTLNVLVTGGPVVVSDNAFANTDWSNSTKVDQMGTITAQQAANGTNAPRREYDFAVTALMSQPHGAIVDEFLSKTYNPAVDGPIVKVDASMEIVSQAAMVVSKMGFGIKQGGKVYLAIPKKSPTPVETTETWSSLVASDFEEYDLATFSTITGSHPNFTSTGGVMTAVVWADCVEPSAMGLDLKLAVDNFSVTITR
ncbi:MAG: hypothetical protein ABL949_03990 [Fimbriimonadaceae bacterium]